LLLCGWLLLRARLLLCAWITLRRCAVSEQAKPGQGDHEKTSTFHSVFLV
jgi:hypothetical protein